MKKSNIIFTLSAFLTALIIMGGIFAGAYYFVINNNVYGLRDKYETEIAKRPLLRWALPGPEDPDDPKYLNDQEIRKKYIQIKEERDNLLRQLEQANLEISNLEIYKNEYEKLLKEMEEEKLYIDAQLSEINQGREELQRLAAENDKEGFRKYYESIDAQKAEEIYREAMLGERTEQEKKKIIQIYENMDEAAAADIFNEMGEENMYIIVGLLSNMKKDVASDILAEMDPSLASKITEQLVKVFGWENSLK
jgi:flagellar motility protein MotE (MotC chaperone)